MDKKRVLVLDDMEMNRSMIKTFLTFYHFDIDLAEDGLKGLEFLKSQKYDLIFSDIEMPNMTGLEFLARVKKNTETQSIPVVMLSSLDKSDVIEKAKSLGASAYMVKPFTKQKMDDALKELGFV